MKGYKIQPDKEFDRHWFQDGQMDLVVWHQADKIHGFQLTYSEIENGFLEQKVITFFEGEKIRHSHIPNENRQVPTPKLLEPETHHIPGEKIITYLRTHQGDISDPILNYISEVLREFKTLK